jgi:hypothetical protein
MWSEAMCFVSEIRFSVWISQTTLGFHQQRWMLNWRKLRFKSLFSWDAIYVPWSKHGFYIHMGMGQN